MHIEPSVPVLCPPPLRARRLRRRQASPRGPARHLPARSASGVPSRFAERIAAPLAAIVFLGILAVLFAGLPGCAPAPRPPLPVVTGLDHLQARVAQLDTRLTRAVEFGAGCKAGCVSEPVRFRSLPGGELVCDCRTLPSLGVHRIPAPSTAGAIEGAGLKDLPALAAEGTGLETPAALASLPTTPGAEPAARAGLSSASAAPQGAKE